MESFEEINSLLLSKAILHYGCKQVTDILNEEDVSICSDFLGFVDFYYKISKIISYDSIVIDFGCGLGFQHLFFDKHIGYIGIDCCDWSRGVKISKDKNYCFLKETICDFISKFRNSDEDIKFLLNLLRENGCQMKEPYITPRIVGVCNKVPNVEARELVNNTFLNVFNYY